MCKFNEQYIYVFCGKHFENNKNLTTIEQFDIKKYEESDDHKWNTLTIEKLDDILVPRMWAGASQINET